MEIAESDGYSLNSYTTGGEDGQVAHWKETGIWSDEIGDVKAGDYIYWSKKGSDVVSHAGIVTAVSGDGKLTVYRIPSIALIIFGRIFAPNQYFAQYGNNQTRLSVIHTLIG